jgi:oligoribonuclease (3'-5' exoribonuclease)
MLCFVDTETGGLTPDFTLLEAAFVITDDSLNVKNTLSFALAPDDSVYRVHPRALEVNRIDIMTHHRRAVTYTQSGAMLSEFLYPYQQHANRLTIAGWNVAFDLNFLRSVYDERLVWDTLFSHRVLDVQVVSRFLQLLGRLPSTLGSLDSHVRHYGLAIAQEHTALSDCMMTIEVLKRLRDVC